MHTKIQGHQPFGSGEDLFSFLPYMGMAAILVMWPQPFEQNFVPPSHRSSKWNLTLIGPVVSEEKMFKECGRRTMTYNGWRTTEASLSYELTKWAFGSGELIITRGDKKICGKVPPFLHLLFKSDKISTYNRAIHTQLSAFTMQVLVVLVFYSRHQGNGTSRDPAQFALNFVSSFMVDRNLMAYN